jgi:hypothetical protein
LTALSRPSATDNLGGKNEQAWDQLFARPRSLVWLPLDQAPVGEPVLLLVQGREDPVVAIRDNDGDWQVTWTGDLIIDAIRWAPIPPGFDAPA